MAALQAEHSAEQHQSQVATEEDESFGPMLVGKLEVKSKIITKTEF